MIRHELASYRIDAEMLRRNFSGIRNEERDGIGRHV
jgi:hypothetical protein